MAKKTNYTWAEREEILKRALPPENMRIAELAEVVGVTRTTLYDWRNKINKKNTDEKALMNLPSEVESPNAEQAPFLDLDELCTDRKNSPYAAGNGFSRNEEDCYVWNSSDAFDNMLQELAMEKLMEMTKYINFNYATGTCKINRKALNSAGYRVEIY